jgi:hypothetical protein
MLDKFETNINSFDLKTARTAVLKEGVIATSAGTHAGNKTLDRITFV